MVYSMVLSAFFRKCLMLSALMLCLPTLASAQRVPTPPTNLKVLPADMDEEAVRAVMGKFRQALDVRCSYCHAAKEGSTRGLDYASDEKETKRIARVMMKMTQAINNTHLPETGRATHEMVTCETCHHGSPKPKMLGVELGKVDAKEGIDAAVDKYKSLRELYYGRATYDFGENSLLSFVGILRQSEGVKRRLCAFVN
jgi:hypothetical protein